MRWNVTKLVGSLILAILLLIFSSQNLDHVWVRFIVGPAVQMPTIVLIAGAVLVGYSIATFNYIVRTSKSKSRFEESEE